MRRVPFALFAAPVAALIAAGCASTQPVAEAPAPAPAAAAPAPAPVAPAPVEAPKPRIAAEFYELYHDNGRVYRFYDWKTYQDFAATGEAAFALSQIGAGPQGQTVVWVQTKADAGKASGFPAMELLAGNLVPDDFYGEVVYKGRIYVAGALADLMAFREHFEAAYAYSDIGAGPKGETVVYVLNKKTADKRPDALMAAFKARRGL